MTLPFLSSCPTCFFMAGQEQGWESFPLLKGLLL